MKREDLFAAIGEVEENRLQRSELAVRPSVDSITEENDMKNRKTHTRRLIRNLLIAAVIVSMLAVTAYAVGGFVIFESPEEMISTIFGDDTGFDHSAGSVTPDPLGSPEGVIVEPTFDRVPADESVVAEDIAPNVSPVGQSISWNGYTLTVDSYLYDSATRCGFFTYLLENPNGLPEYKLQSTGEIWYDGVPDIVDVNQYGYPYIIQEKTTDTCLAATYYFQFDERMGKNLEISFNGNERNISDEEIAVIIAELDKKIREEMTPEQAIDAVIDIVGEAIFEESTRGLPDGVTMDMETYRADYAYTVLAHNRYREQYQDGGEKIVVCCDAEGALAAVSAEDGSIVVTPISFQIDVTNLEFLREGMEEEHRVLADNVDDVIIRYSDGTEYVVDEGYTMNYVFASVGSATNGDEDAYNMLTYMFNRIIDVDKVGSIVVNGVELPLD